MEDRVSDEIDGLLEAETVDIKREVAEKIDYAIEEMAETLRDTIRKELTDLFDTIRSEE